MSFSIFRGFLVIAFVGLVSTAAATTVLGGPAPVFTPHGCTIAAECGHICSQSPEQCVPYCSADAAHAVACGEWARAYQSSSVVEAAQFSAPMPDGGSFSGMSSFSGSAGMGAPMGSPNIGAGEPMPGSTPPGSMMGSPQTGSTNMMGNQSGNITPPLMGRPDMRPGEPVLGSTPPRTEFQQLPTGREFPGQGAMGDQSRMRQDQPQMMGAKDTQTCRVDGVEVQGRCEEMDRQSQKPRGIDLGAGVHGAGPGGCLSPEECKSYCEKGDNKQGCEGFFKNFQSAPRDFQTREQSRPEFQKQTGQSQEEFDKQRQEGEERFAKEHEEQQKRVQEQMLSQMKRGMQQMTRMIKQLESRITALARRKVKIPDEVTANMAQLKELVVKAQNITEPEEMGEIGPQIGELVQDINERFGGLERLAEFPRMVAQANRMIRQFESQVKRLEAKVNARKLDVGDTLTEAKALLSEMKTARDAAAAAAAQGDAEGAFEQLQEGVFERGDEIGDKMSALEIVVQAPQRIAQMNRELRTMESRMKQLARKGQDMTEAKSLLADARAKLTTITGLTKQRPMPTEEIMSMVEELEDVVDQIRNQLGQSDQPEFKPFELELPAGLQIASSGSEGGTQ